MEAAASSHDPPAPKDLNTPHAGPLSGDVRVKYRLPPVAGNPNVPAASKAIARPDPQGTAVRRVRPMAPLPYPSAIPTPEAADPDESRRGRHADFLDDRGRWRPAYLDLRFGFSRDRLPIDDALTIDATAQQQRTCRER